MNVAAEWWREFFHGVVLDLWSEAVPAEQTQAEAAFLCEVLGAPAGGRLLDVPCGNGRLSLALAERGFQVTGIDIAEAFIRRARDAAAVKHLSAVFDCREMRELPGSAEFDGAFCFGNSFGYLDDAGTVAFLQRVSGALRPGARFVIDIPMVAESLLPALEERAWYPVGAMHLLIRNDYDVASGRLKTEYTFIRDGQVETRYGSHRVFSYREIVALLAEAGFAIGGAYSSLGREPYRFRAPKLLLVAERRPERPAV